MQVENIQTRRLFLCLLSILFGFSLFSQQTDTTAFSRQVRLRYGLQASLSNHVYGASASPSIPGTLYFSPGFFFDADIYKRIKQQPDLLIGLNLHLDKRSGEIYKSTGTVTPGMYQHEHSEFTYRVPEAGLSLLYTPGVFRQWLTLGSSVYAGAALPVQTSTRVWYSGTNAPSNSETKPFHQINPLHVGCSFNLSCDIPVSHNTSLIVGSEVKLQTNDISGFKPFTSQLNFFIGTTFANGTKNKRRSNDSISEKYFPKHVKWIHSIGGGAHIPKDISNNGHDGGGITYQVTEQVFYQLNKPLKKDNRLGIRFGIMYRKGDFFISFLSPGSSSYLSGSFSTTRGNIEITRNKFLGKRRGFSIGAGVYVGFLLNSTVKVDKASSSTGGKSYNVPLNYDNVAGMSTGIVLDLNQRIIYAPNSALLLGVKFMLESRELNDAVPAGKIMDIYIAYKFWKKQ
jgi:hypothetical protein